MFFLCKRRSRRRQWTKDLEVAKAGYGEDGTSNSGDSGSSGGSARPGGLGRKVAAYMPFGTNSNESVDATPHAKHARMDDGFAGISRFKPDGTLKVPPPRQPHLISSAAAAAAAVPGQMGTILERKTFSAPPAQPGGANLHDTANLMDSHSNNVQTAAEHAMLSPTSLFSFGTPIGRHSDPFRPPGLPSRQSDGRLSSDGSANLLLRGGSGDQLLGVQASGEYSDRFQELEPMGVRKASRQYSGSVDANLWSVSAYTVLLCCCANVQCDLLCACCVCSAFSYLALLLFPCCNASLLLLLARVTMVAVYMHSMPCRCTASSNVFQSTLAQHLAALQRKYKASAAKASNDCTQVNA